MNNHYQKLVLNELMRLSSKSWKDWEVINLVKNSGFTVTGAYGFWDKQWKYRGLFEYVFNHYRRQ